MHEQSMWPYWKCHMLSGQSLDNYECKKKWRNIYEKVRYVWKNNTVVDKNQDSFLWKNKGIFHMHAGIWEYYLTRQYSMSMYM